MERHLDKLRAMKASELQGEMPKSFAMALHSLYLLHPIFLSQFVKQYLALAHFQFCTPLAKLIPILILKQPTALDLIVIVHAYAFFKYSKSPGKHASRILTWTNEVSNERLEL